MQFVRTLLWIIALVVFVILTVLNWETTLAMRIWPGFVWETRLPAIVVASFLFGLVPTWLVHRGTRWRLNRRISHLEAATRGIAAERPAEAAHAAPPPAADAPPANEPSADVPRPLP